MRPFEAVEIPARLSARPCDKRGYPIPWMVATDSSGQPDFRVTDQKRWVAAVKLRCCSMCGERMGRHLAFIGGPKSFESRLFTDLPMHKDCATYAIQVCPFLAAPNMKYAERLPSMEGVQVVRHTPEMVDERPDRFFLGATTAYEVVQIGQGSVVAHARQWETVEWWRHGARLPD